MTEVTAIVLAAGLSSRMGKPKMLLPWGSTTILGHIVETLSESGIHEMVIVTGAARELVEDEVGRLAQLWPVRPAYNRDYARGEMLSSILTGLAGTSPKADAGLIVLGDQPQIQIETVQVILGTWKSLSLPLIVPSFEGRRGHPWLIARHLWEELNNLQPPASSRDFLEQHRDLICYVNVPTSSILKDVDTPADYARESPA